MRSYGGNANEEVIGMATLPDDRIAATGYFSQSGQFAGANLVSNGFADVFVQSSLSNGAHLWAKSFGGPGQDRGIDVAADEDGNIFLTGFFSQTVDFEGQELTAQGDSLDLFVVKMSAQGDVLWATSTQSAGNDQVTGITTDENGNAYICGQFRGVANFGANSVESAFYEGSSEYSYDGFVAALSPEGEWLWVKAAIGALDNRFMDVTYGDGHLYACGEFSEGLLIDSFYPNDELNNGMLVKFSTEGDEVWMRELAATQVLPVQVDYAADNTVAVSGEMSGVFTFFDDDPDTAPFVPGNVVFALKVEPEGGDFMWLTAYNSTNSLKNYGMDTGPLGEIYLSGNFRCSFTGQADQMGESAFYSMGFRDCFAARVNADGSKEWIHHYAGPGDDSCNDLCVTDENKVFISGGFQRYFHMPSATAWQPYPDNPTLFAFTTPQNAGYCPGEPNYGDFISVQISGTAANTREAFVTNCYDPTMSVIDYFDREGESCERVFPEICIENNSLLECPDTLEGCSNQFLYADMMTGTQNVYGPLYYKTWSNQYNEQLGITDGTGDYWVDIEREDGCRQFNDSIYFIDLPNPPAPLISDEFGINISSANPEDVILCVDSITIWAEVCEECALEWNNQPATSDSLTVLITTSPYATAVNEFGCRTSTEIFLDPVDEQELLGAPVQIMATEDEIQYFNGDTIPICAGESIFYQVIPNPAMFYEGEQLESTWDIFLDNTFYGNFNNESWSLTQFHNQGGWYRFEVLPIDALTTVCDTLSEEMELQVDSFYVEIFPQPEVSLSYSIEPEIVCPGDSVLVTLSSQGGDLLVDAFEGLLEQVSDTSFVLTSSGSLDAQVSALSDLGCPAVESVVIDIVPEPAPVATMDPANGLVCPGEAVTLDVTPGVAYSWTGPLGFEVSDEQQLEAVTPGFYSCTVTSASGCVQESNLLEVIEYSTPYLIVDPGPVICDDEPVTIELITNYPEGASWLPPLSGNNLTQTVTEPGTYWAVATGCGVTVDLQAEIIISDISVDITAMDAEICQGDSTLLTAEGNAESFSWLPGGESAQSIWVDSPGEYVVIAGDGEYCVFYDSLQVAEIPTPLPETSDAVICPGDDVTLNASVDAGEVFWWSDESDETLLGTGSAYAVEDVEDPFTVFAQNISGVCESDQVAVQVSFSPGSVTPELSAPDSVCEGGAVDLFLVDPLEVTYTWNFPDGTSASEPGLTSLSWEEALLLDDGWYAVSASDALCESEADSVYLTVYVPAPLSFDFPSDSLCEGEAFVLNAPAAAEGHYWTTPLDTIDGFQSNIAIAGVDTANAGVYTLELIQAACNYVVEPFELYVGTYPELSLGNEDLECEGAIATIGVESGYDVYEWNNGDDTPTIVVDAPGYYAVTATNAPYCATDADVVIEELDCGEGFYNVFSPNGDATNEFINFGDHSADLKHVWIYNRWGTLVLELSGSVLIWDGRDNRGELLSDGTYYWIAADEMDGRYHGYITLKY